MGNWMTQGGGFRRDTAGALPAAEAAALLQLVVVIWLEYGRGEIQDRFPAVVQGAPGLGEGLTV